MILRRFFGLWLCSAMGWLGGLPLAHAQFTYDPEPEIRAFRQADSLAPPAPGAVVLWGSSSFRLWANYQTDLAGHRVLNRGFGGSQMHEALRYFERVVVPLRPKVLLIYEGDNDLAADKAPAQVLAEFKQLVAVARRHFPALKIGFVSIKASPARAHLRAAQAQANRLIRQFCQQTPGLGYIDIVRPMLDAKGQPRPSLFEADGLHVTAEAYRLWARPVLKFLRQ
ncbi:MAG: GDSL-type esterase/lipase family protein [Bernardetiaceae bacterium]|nr:GDSL-type esterase/lipase family protein [Bernardetiaceae bacterium]